MIFLNAFIEMKRVKPAVSPCYTFLCNVTVMNTGEVIHC